MRCTVILIFLAGCATAAEPPVQSAPPDAAAVTEAAVEQTDTGEAQARGDDSAAEDSPAEETDTQEVTKVFVESENFRYSMTLRRPNETDPRIMCSYGRRTGSHFHQKYCRTTEESEQEREAARKFFREARRKGN